MNVRQTLWIGGAVCVLLMTAGTLFGASKERVLHSFNITDGFAPVNGLIFDTAGNLYGTTGAGGTAYGTVFELSPHAGGKWTETVLYNFQGGADGAGPQSSLILDAAGNLYGTTIFGGGGSGQGCSAGGCGSVFELSPGANGTWTETILHSFNNNGTDGSGPVAGLIFDAAGNLYGTTQFGGFMGGNCAQGCGTVFELSPGANGAWTETILHTFCHPISGCTDGNEPWAGLIFDGQGNLYGTTLLGGAYDSGTVFELSPNSDGSWTQTVLYNFGAYGGDGGQPFGRVIFDGAGNLYGTTVGGGSVGAIGTVFELSPGANGTWTETLLNSFGKHDGRSPVAGVVFDGKGNLYGTTEVGGQSRNCRAGGCGVVFKLAPGEGGIWHETVLHVFGGKDGSNPKFGSLIFDKRGNLYGTTEWGGVNHQGTVFKVTP